MSAPRSEPLVFVPSGHTMLEGILELPTNPFGVVVFSHLSSEDEAASG
jgi:hypothetical protein